MENITETTIVCYILFFCLFFGVCGLRPKVLSFRV